MNKSSSIGIYIFMWTVMNGLICYSFYLGYNIGTTDGQMEMEKIRPVCPEDSAIKEAEKRVDKIFDDISELLKNNSSINEISFSDKKESPKKNKVVFYGGIGQSGINVKKVGHNFAVNPSFGPIGGLGYSRELTKTISAEAVITTNKCLIGGIGIKF